MIKCVCKHVVFVVVFAMSAALTPVLNSPAAHAAPMTDAEVAPIVATILNASQAGRPIRIGGFYDGLNLPGVGGIMIALEGGQWFIEVSSLDLKSLEPTSYLHTNDIKAVSIEGVKLDEAIKNKSVAVSEKQLEFIRNVQEIIRASVAGKKITLQQNFGTSDPSRTAFEIPEFTDAVIRSNNGKYEFEMFSIPQTDFANIKIDGANLANANRANVIQSCRSLFISK